MGSKFAERLAARGRHFTAAAEDLHHLQLGPGPKLEAEWAAAGLALPDLRRMREYRLDRTCRSG